MDKKLENLINQLSTNEQVALAEYIERQYAVEFKEKTMLRDDILYKITEQLHMEFTQIGWDDVDEDQTLGKGLELDPVEVYAFSETLANSFEIEEIAFAKVMEWATVKDIVNYIETTLEDKDYEQS